MLQLVVTLFWFVGFVLGWNMPNDGYATMTHYDLPKLVVFCSLKPFKIPNRLQRFLFLQGRHSSVRLHSEVGSLPYCCAERFSV